LYVFIYGFNDLNRSTFSQRKKFTPKLETVMAIRFTSLMPDIEGSATIRIGYFTSKNKVLDQKTYILHFL